MAKIDRFPEGSSAYQSITELIGRAVQVAAAGDARAAIAALLDAWREVPAVALAETIERLTAAALPGEPPPYDEAVESGDQLEVGRLVDRLRDVNAASAIGRVAKLRFAPDPRIAAAIVRLLEDPPYHATGSKPFWTRVFTLLHGSPDPRTRPRLEAIHYATIIRGASMRGWMTGKVAAAVHALAEQFPTEPGLPAGIEQELARITLADAKTPVAGPRAKKALSERDLFLAVHESPDDDGPRAVLADFLIEKGDPRGQFINLQLARDPAHAKSELALIRKYQKSWLGELAPFVKYLAYPSVAPTDPQGIAMWWRRGFLAGCMVAFTKPKLVELGTSPMWSTVERVSGLATTDDPTWNAALLRMLGGLRAVRHLINANPGLLALFERVPAITARLETLAFFCRASEQRACFDRAAMLERLRRVEITSHYGDRPELKTLLSSSLWTRVQEVCFTSVFGAVELRRDATGLVVTVDGPRAGVEGLLAELPTEQVVSFALQGYGATRKWAEQLVALFPKAKLSVRSAKAAS